MKPVIAFVAFVLAVACGAPAAHRFAIDEAHHNYHTASGRYEPFAQLLRAQGFAVHASTERFDTARLQDIDVLVVANAVADEPDRPAISDAEAAAVRSWVERGGSLWLIADHFPFGAAVAPLARAIGVEMSNGVVGDERHFWSGADEPGNIVYTASTGLAAAHPIAQSVRTVVTFVGQSLRGPANSVSILTLSDDAREMFPPNRDMVAPRGRSQALAFSLGRGRVFVAGEAAMFTEQVKRDGTPMGMNAPGNDDRQLTINVARWLAHRL
jgi:hypothetical protein